MPSHPSRPGRPHPTRPTRRRTQPEPPVHPTETAWARLRRKARRKIIRLHDWAIHVLYELISWIDTQTPTEKRYFRAAIFGSSRIRTEDADYARVRELARQLSFIGCDIVTGGGPGLMMAANEGARSGAYRYKTRSFGLSILLPLEEQPNPFLDEQTTHKTFFSRLHEFIRLSHAYIVVDGGIGTTLEAMMVLQLLQVGVLEENRTLVFVGPMWKGLRHWLEREVVHRGLADQEHVEIAHWVDSVEEAVEIVRRERDRFLERHEVVLPPPADGPEESEAAAG
jgi:uncharacterized protein (TIGR00730 family)